MKSYRVRPGKSFLHFGVSHAPGSVVTAASCRLSEVALDMMSKAPRDILEALGDDGPEPFAAKPSGPAKDPGAVVTDRPPEAGDVVEDIDFETLSKSDLKSEAAARRIDAPASWNKSQLIAAIEAHDAKIAQDANTPTSKFEKDPATLRGQSLANLNLMLAETTGGKMGPMDTAEECIAVLSKDFKGSR